MCAVLVLSVIMCSFHYFLDRVLFHHDFHHDSCDYYWDFYGQPFHKAFICTREGQYLTRRYKYLTHRAMNKMADIYKQLQMQLFAYKSYWICHPHYNDVTMSAMESQITSLTVVYSTVYSGADQRKHQSSASLAFVRGIHRWPVYPLLTLPILRI